MQRSSIVGSEFLHDLDCCGIASIHYRALTGPSSVRFLIATLMQQAECVEAADYSEYTTRDDQGSARPHLSELGLSSLCSTI